MTIKIDIDNTIRDIASEMVALYNSKYDCGMTVDDIFDYDVCVSFPKLKEDNIDARQFFFFDNSVSVFALAPVLDGAVEGIRKIRELGHRVVLVTYQPDDNSKITTLIWLKKNNIEYDSIVFTNTPSKKDVVADYIVDDNPKFLAEDDGVKVCVAWRYNEDCPCDMRVNTIKDLADIISSKK